MPITVDKLGTHFVLREGYQDRYTIFSKDECETCGREVQSAEGATDVLATKDQLLLAGLIEEKEALPEIYYDEDTDMCVCDKCLDEKCGVVK